MKVKLFVVLAVVIALVGLHFVVDKQFTEAKIENPVEKGTNYNVRQITSVRQKDTSSSLQTCLSDADESYFSDWQNACQKQSDSQVTSNYAYCLSWATHDIPSQSSYTTLHMIRKPSIADCEYLLKTKPFKTNCALTDGSGKPLTMEWQRKTNSCTEKYAN